MRELWNAPRALGQMSRRGKRFSLVVVGFTTIALCLSALPAGAGGSKEPFKIAVVHTLTTPAGATGAGGTAGLKAYAKKLNDGKGINGRDLEVLEFDGANDLAQLTAYVKQQAADPDVLAVMGLGQFQHQVPLASLVDELKIPAFTFPTAPYAMYGALSTIPHHWLFGLGLDVTTAEPKVMTDFVLKDTPKASVGMFGVNAPSIKAGIDAMSKIITDKGGKIIGTELIVPTATDVRASANNLLDAKPDWIIVGGAAPVHIQSLLNTIKVSSRPDQKVLTLGGAGTVQFEQADSKGYHSSAPALQATKKIRKLVEETGGGATLQGDDTFVTTGWILGMVFEAALKACGNNCTRETLRDSLEAIDGLKTGNLSGPVSFKADHEGFRTAGIFQWDAKKKKPVLVAPGWLPAYG